MQGSVYDLSQQFNKDAVERIIDANEKLQEEIKKEDPNESIVTKLMFEQMLRGLYMQCI